jgi:hypothetical protein
MRSARRALGGAGLGLTEDATVASDSTFTWNGGTGSASDQTNWTVTGPSNSPNVPLSDDSIVMTIGDAQFINTPLPGPDDTVYGGTVFFQGGTIDMINRPLCR